MEHIKELFGRFRQSFYWTAALIVALLFLVTFIGGVRDVLEWPIGIDLWRAIFLVLFFAFVLLMLWDFRRAMITPDKLQNAIERFRPSIVREAVEKAARQALAKELSELAAYSGQCDRSFRGS